MRVFLLTLLSACGVDDAVNGNDLAAFPDDALPPPPTLTIGGRCPGAVTIDVTGASPGGQVYVVSGSGPGHAVVPTGPCAGLNLGLSNPMLRTKQRADAHGEVHLAPTVQAPVCAHYLQVVDATSCTVARVTGLSQPGGGQTYAIGGQTSHWTASSYFRGNVFHSAHGGGLASFSVYLDPQPGCALDFYVHERAPFGRWTAIASAQTVAAGGPGRYDSGRLNLTLSPGMDYGLGVAWSCSATYFGDNGAFVNDYGVGTFVQNYWDNAYRGFDPAYTPPNLGNGGLAYDHAYVVR